MERAMLVALASLVGTLSLDVARADPTDLQQILDDHDKLVQAARQQYEAAVDKANRQTVPVLLKAAVSSEKAGNDEEAGRFFTEILRLERDNEQARAYFRRARKLDTVLTQLIREWSPVIAAATPEAERATYYETMLGCYRGERPKDSLPARTLVVPNGRNVFDDVLKARAAIQMGVVGKADLHGYEATGHFVVPVEGKYWISGYALGFRIDGEDVKGFRDEKRPPQAVFLKAGLHDIYLSSVEGYHPFISIKDARGRPVPIFNSLAEIKEFLAPPTEVNATLPFDVSRWSPTRARSLRIVFPLTDENTK